MDLTDSSWSSGYMADGEQCTLNSGNLDKLTIVGRGYPSSNLDLKNQAVDLRTQWTPGSTARRRPFLPFSLLLFLCYSALKFNVDNFQFFFWWEKNYSKLIIDKIGKLAMMMTFIGIINLSKLILKNIFVSIYFLN